MSSLPAEELAMNLCGLPCLVLVTVYLLTAAAFAGDTGGAGIPLRELQRICTGPGPNDAERSMAEVLRTGLRDLYGTELSVWGRHGNRPQFRNG
jgi:hypothetical protein